jgi:hypothetical protein
MLDATREADRGKHRMGLPGLFLVAFFFKDTATTEVYTDLWRRRRSW